MDSFSRLFQEVPDFGEVLFYAVIVGIMVIAVVFGRFLIRGLVNRRVHGIHAEGLNLGDLTTLGKKGLLTEEELKLIRRRVAERQLEETQAEKAGLKAKDLLLAIEADPARATSLLPPSSEHARRALEGLKAGSARSVEEQLRAQLGPSTAPAPPSTDSPVRSMPPVPPAAAASAGQSARPEPQRPAPDRPADDAHPPFGTESQKRTAGASGSGGAGLDLDAMLAKGLISQREYDLLMARVRKAGGR